MQNIIFTLAIFKYHGMELSWFSHGMRYPAFQDGGCLIPSVHFPTHHVLTQRMLECPNIPLMFKILLKYWYQWWYWFFTRPLWYWNTLGTMLHDCIHWHAFYIFYNSIFLYIFFSIVLTFWYLKWILSFFFGWCSPYNIFKFQAKQRNFYMNFPIFVFFFFTD